MVSLLSCTEANVDSVTEKSCTLADGLWTVVAATCDGNAVASFNPVTYLFDKDNSTVLQTSGRADCATRFLWNVEIGDKNPLFSMQGQGALSCLKSGEESSYCSSEVNSCSSGIDITGIHNEYPVCVIRETGMSLTRTVSAINNPDNLSYCQVGQIEEVILVQGDYTPPVPEPEPEELRAYLQVTGPNPLDFGTYAVGERVTKTITLKNSGTSSASNVVGVGLNTPFHFDGGHYPGDGGTCDKTLEVNASCTIVIEFSANVARYYTDELIIHYSDGTQPVTISHGLAATASDTLGQLTLSDGPYYNFGAIAVGSSLNHIFTLSNSGGGDAVALSGQTLPSPFSYIGGSYPGTGGDCGSVVLAGQSCQLAIEFSPIAEGSFNEVLQIDYLDGVNNRQAKRNIFGQGQLSSP